MWFKKKTDNDDIDFDNDVAPIAIPPREKTLPELLNEVLKRIEKIEKKIDQILTESPK